MGGRLDALEVELGDPLDVLEDPGELAGHPLDLLVGEPQPREPGDVQHLFRSIIARGFIGSGASPIRRQDPRASR